MINGHSKNSSVKRINVRDVFSRPVDIKQMLLNNPSSTEIQECLNQKRLFGLRSGRFMGNIIVFDVKHNHVYDYSQNKFTPIDAGNYHTLLNYLRLSLDDYNIYVNAEDAIRFLREKNAIQ